MPADIRLDDLVNPRLPQSFLDQAKLLEPLAAAARLEPDSLIDRAIEENASLVLDGVVLVQGMVDLNAYSVLV